MELVDLARVLSRRPALLLLGGLLALLIAVTQGGGGQAAGATASTRVLVDTPKSQVVAAKPGGLDTLLWRAGLMANLLSTSESVRFLAAEAGVRPEEVAVVDPFLSTPPTGTSLAGTASDAASTVYAKYVLAIETDDYLPFITLQAATPDPATARRLADAAVQLLARQGTNAGTAELQGLNVRQTSPLQVKSVPTSHAKLLAVIGAVVFFAFWCAALAIVPALLRLWRATLRLGTA